MGYQKSDNKPSWNPQTKRWHVVAAFKTVISQRVVLSLFTGAVATLLPLVITIANKLGINPVWLGMICVVSSSIAFFIPSQSPNVLTTYAYGYYTTKDLSKVGLLLVPLFIGIILIIARWYWPLIGLTIRP